MALLPDDPKNQYRLLGVILIVALGGLYYLYFHRPKGDDLLELETRVEQIEQQNELAEARMQNLDAVRQEFEYGGGGVPWYLLLGYLAFLAFFTWYTLEYQLPDFIDQGPVPIEAGESTASQ